MTVALITTSPFAIVSIFGGVPNPVQLPNGNRVYGAAVGWTDNGYSLISVPAFVPPGGQVITGSPSYQIDGSGNVTETYSTAAAPALSWPPITIIKALQTIQKSKADLFINKMSSSDQARFMSSSSIAVDSPLLIAALAEPSVNITVAALTAAINGLTGN